MKDLQIIFSLEKEIFYLFCFLNLIGYDVENNPKGMHPFRRFVRIKLKNKIKTSNYKSLQKYVLSKHQGQFVQWLLQKKYNNKSLDKFYSKKELTFFDKFDTHFRKFINGEKDKLFEEKFKDDYFSEKEKRERVVFKVLNDLIDGLNLNFTSLDLKKIIIVPNLLDAYGYGYGPKVGKNSFIVYGPLRDKNFRLITHEFLHSVINPIVLNNKKFLKKIKKFDNNNLDKKLKEFGYSNWPVFIEEYLVRAVNIKMYNFNSLKREKILKEEEIRGFKNIRKTQLLLKKDIKRMNLLTF